MALGNSKDYGRAAAFQRLRILAADDSASLRALLGAMLAEVADVVFAADGAQAVAASAGGRFDLILMDLRMPVMDGLDATRLIRRRDGRAAPIIMLSGEDDAAHRRTAAEAGVAHFLSKPVHAETLFAAIETALAPARQP